jgi:hypothetical protein
VDADPKHANNLGNYGQFLVGLARVEEGTQALTSAFGHVNRDIVSDCAELCFGLWLVGRTRGLGSEDWERAFKFFIQRGFPRSPWNFDAMLRQAEMSLPAEELKYANALADAFLDQNKVAALEKYERWRALVPLDPWQNGQKMDTNQTSRPLDDDATRGSQLDVSAVHDPASTT